MIKLVIKREVAMFGKVEELAIVLVIILVLFGAKKLPELSRGLAESVREVRRGFRDDGAASPAKSAAADSKTNAS